jgi:hypothetical protein
MPVPLEKLCHSAVFPLLGQLSPRYRKYTKIPKGKLLLDIFLQNTVMDALIVHIFQELFVSDSISIVLRRKQARVGTHPVL